MGYLRQPVGFEFVWVIAAVLAVTVVVAAVTGLGSDPRHLENNEPPVEKTFSADFGQFVAVCRGRLAIGVEARPDEAAGWLTVSYEPGPDDDIDAVFSNGRRSQELEIHCVLGRPVLSEIENDTIPDD